MATLLRLILALSIAIQSLPVLAMGPCRIVERNGSAAALVEAPCTCCCQSSSSDRSGPAVCSCKAPGQDQPQAPQPEREYKSVAQFLAFLPAVVTAPLAADSRFSLPRAFADAHPQSSAPSPQSLLCVWLM